MMLQDKKSARKDNKTSQSKHGPKRMLLILVITGILITIAGVVSVFIFNNRSTKLSDAYYRCADTFSVEFPVYLKPGTTKETLESMAAIMREDNNVKSVKTSTSEEEYEKIYQTYKDSDNQSMLTTLEIVGRELMISRMQAIIRIEVYDANDLSAIKRTINNNGIFTENLDKDFGVSYPSEFSTIELLGNSGNGKVIEIAIMEDEGNSGIEKIGCICAALNMPDRIKDAIINTEVADGTQQDSWDSFIVRWYHKEKRTRITSEFYATDKKLYATIYEN